MNKQFAEVVLKFLDRVSIQGHQERQLMDQVCGEFIRVIKEADAEAEGAEVAVQPEPAE